MTNLISNAIKFMADGAVQPFVWKVSNLIKAMLLTSQEGAMIVCDGPQKTKKEDQ